MNDMKSRYLHQIEVFLSYIPLCFLLLWSVQVLIGMITINPYGSYVISFVPSISSGSWTLGRHIRGFTLLSVTIAYIIVYYLTSYLRPILRTTCSVLVPFVGLIHYEFWWHTGLQFTMGIWPGETRFWRAFAICLLMSLYYVNRYYIKILDLSRNRILMLACVYTTFILSLIAVMKSGFYQQFLLWCNGTAPDPHNWLWALNKTIGVVMWITIIRSDDSGKGQ